MKSNQNHKASAKKLFDQIEPVVEKMFDDPQYTGLRLMIERDVRGKMPTMTLRVGPEKRIQKRVKKVSDVS